jgi:hypothetical protein
MFLRSIERGFQRRADLDPHPSAGLPLPQPNVSAVIARPRQPQEIALPLAGPQREQQRQMQMRGRRCEKGRFVLDAPHEVNAGAVVGVASMCGG